MKKILVFVLSLLLLSTSSLAATKTLVPDTQYAWYSGGWNGFGNCALLNPTDFWQCLDDYIVLFSDNSGTHSTTADAEIQYSMTNMSSNLGIADSITFKYRSQKHPRGTKCYRPLVSIVNIPVANESCNFELFPTVCDTANDWTVHSFTSSVNPCSELPWSFAEINRLMVGMKARTGAYPAGGYVDAVWVVVDY